MDGAGDASYERSLDTDLSLFVLRVRSQGDTFQARHLPDLWGHYGKDEARSVVGDFRVLSEGREATCRLELGRVHFPRSTFHTDPSGGRGLERGGFWSSITGLMVPLQPGLMITRSPTMRELGDFSVVFTTRDGEVFDPLEGVESMEPFAIYGDDWCGVAYTTDGGYRAAVFGVRSRQELGASEAQVEIEGLEGRYSARFATRS